MNLPLLTKDEIMDTPEYLKFMKATSNTNDMNLIELYEVNAASVIANSVPEAE